MRYTMFSPPNSWYELPDSRPEYGNCACCNDPITLWHPRSGDNKDIRYCWFDEKFQLPCCSDSCRDQEEKDNHEDVIDDYETEDVLRLILASR